MSLNVMPICWSSLCNGTYELDEFERAKSKNESIGVWGD
jgi:hypothetical protein